MEAWDPVRVRRALARPFDVRDSKQVFSQKGLRRGEVAALSVLHALTGEWPSTAGALIDGIAIEASPALPCRGGSAAGPCSVDSLSLPLWADRSEIEERASRLRSALLDEGLAGPVNAVAPGPVSNAEFTRILARVLRRPALAPVPAAIVRLAFGEMGKELLLASTRVLPRRLEGTGFDFLRPDLETALRAELGLLDG